MSPSPPPEPRRILAVDDSPVQLRMMRAALDRAGFEVEEASNGAEALLRISESPFHLVLSDCHMPLMDGYQLCRLLKDDPETAELPVVLLTGAQNRLARFWARTCGADLFLTKGQKLDAVVAAVDHLAQGGPRPPRPQRRAREQGDTGLDAIQRRLAKALEHRLLRTTLGSAVGELRTQVADPEALGWAYLTLLEDLVLPGALYLVAPSPHGPRCQVLASDNLEGGALDRLVCDLKADPLAVGQKVRIDVNTQSMEGKGPRQLHHVSFPLPVAGGGFQGRWGLLIEHADFQVQQDLFQEADKQFQQVFSAMVTLEYLVDANRRLLRADQARAEFVSTVVHEIRNPLAATSSAIRLLKGQWEQGGAEHSGELLGICQRNIDRLLRISNSVLDMEKLESGQFVCHPVSLDPYALCAGTVEDLRSLGASRRVELDLPAPARPLPRVWADPDRAAQCLVNLLSNAIFHSPDGGVVQLRFHPQAEVLELEVRDQGPGIPEPFRERLFQKFQQAENLPKGGTGLGLAITKGLMEAMGGSVRYESHPGLPTSFYLAFPLATKARPGSG